MRVAQRFIATTRGVVAFRMRRIFDVHAGFQRRHEELTLEGVYKDGVVAKVIVSSYTIDGKPASAADRSTVEQAWEHPQPGNVFARPYDPANFTAYQYRSAGPQTIAFSSNVNDQAHGNGTFTFDAAGNVLSVTYRPNALPPHAQTGEISDRRAQVLPGYWSVAQENQQYSGRYAVFPGAGTVSMTYYNFRRFPDLTSALRSI